MVDFDKNGQPSNPAINKVRRETRVIAEMLGLAKGLTVNGKVTSEGARYFFHWIYVNKGDINVWPFSAVKEHVLRLTPDQIDDQELEAMYNFFQDLIGEGYPYEEKVPDKEKEIPPEFLDKNGAIRLPLTTPVPEIVFSQHYFCLTGQFYYGNRQQISGIIENLGGMIRDGIDWSLNYLVVGNVASRDWYQSSYGRKIEQAVENNKKRREYGYEDPLYIISEDSFADAVKRFTRKSIQKNIDEQDASITKEISVTWEEHILPLLKEILENDGLEHISYEQCKSLFKINNDKLGKKCVLKIRYGKYGVNRIDDADGKEIIDIRYGNAIGKRAAAKIKKLFIS